MAVNEKVLAFKQARSIAELDSQWIEYLRLIHADLERIAKVLETMNQKGIIAYPRA